MMNKIPISILETDNSWVTTHARLLQAAKQLSTLEGKMKDTATAVVKEIYLPFGFEFNNKVHDNFNGLLAQHNSPCIDVLAVYNFVCIQMPNCEENPHTTKVESRPDEPVKTPDILSPDSILDKRIEAITIGDILAERGAKYGPWSSHAHISQELKDTMRTGRAWSLMEPYMMETLDMVAQKLGRILNGDPYYKDSWVDIAGFIQLVVNELDKETK